MPLIRRMLGIFLPFLLVLGCGSTAQNRDVILATTTSTQDSGLLDVLIPIFEEQSGFRVKTIAVGSGQALSMGDRGEADLVLAHSPADELRLVKKDSVINRRLVMHNDLIIVGPSHDPAKIRAAKTAADALRQVAQAKSLFISRGDNSGTHQTERSLWLAAGLNPHGVWYQEIGSGMGQALTIANEKDAYTLADQATYLALQKVLSLVVLFERDPALLNLYHVMEVNPERFSKVNAPGARALADFLLSTAGQAAIAQFGVDRYGQPLFVPDGGQTEEQLTGKS